MKKNNLEKKSLNLHRKHGGKFEIKSKVKVKNFADLSLVYTPGVAHVSTLISKNRNLAKLLTIKKNTVAVLTDGSAVLGLGNIGAEAAIPVMEGKAILMKEFGGVDGFPICVRTQDTNQIIDFIKNIELSFGGINLEDISAPKCFEIESVLKKELDIPIMHDDQWGAAVVTLSALINSLRLANKSTKEVRLCIVGAGAAGVGTARLLNSYGFRNIVCFDSQGAISSKRNNLTKEKRELATFNKNSLTGSLGELISNFDVFIGLSKSKILNEEMINKMKTKPIIFALANPEPEIYPSDALKAGAFIVGTGRSDFPNQINNSLFFPGFWAGMLKRKDKEYDMGMLIACAKTISKNTKNITVKKILPTMFEKKIHREIERTVLKYKMR